MAGNQLPSVNHIVQLMLENRSFDHMLGFLYAGAGNVSPAGQPFEGLTGSESNTDASGNTVRVYQIDHAAAGAYFMPGADPGEGYANTNVQLFGSGKPPSPPAAASDRKSANSPKQESGALRVSGKFLRDSGSWL